MLRVFLIVSSAVVVAVASPQIDIQTGRRVYSGYQVIRTYPSTPGQKAALLRLSAEVDFWSDEDSWSLEQEGAGSREVDMMVAPDLLELVTALLNLYSIPFKVLITDVERSIEEENTPEPSLDSDEPAHGILGNRREKRQNSESGETSFLSLLNLPQYFLNPIVRTRRRPQETVARKGRKFGGSGNSSPPALNAPVSVFSGKDGLASTDGGKDKCTHTGMNWLQYQPVTVVNRWMECLAANMPTRVEIIQIGKSSEGRPLWVARVFKDANKSQSIFVDGGMHAREWISPASVTFILHTLAETNQLDHVLDNYDVYLLPFANPDGYEYSRNHDRMWRKTRSKSGVKNFLGQECFGVDPNRNFGWRWGGHGASKNACEETYRGPHAFSEPETRAIRDFLASGRNIELYLTFHSYGQYILYPWGYDAVDSPDRDELQRVGTRAAIMLNNKFGSAYEVGSAAKLLYPASGGSDDWAKGGAGVKYSFTVELPDTGKHGFILPARYIQGVGVEALTCLDTMLNQI